MVSDFVLGSCVLSLKPKTKSDATQEFTTQEFKADATQEFKVPGQNFRFLRRVVFRPAGMPRRPAESSGQPRPSSDSGRGIAPASGGRLRARPVRPFSSRYPSRAR